jgi:proline iminopeptidase
MMSGCARGVHRRTPAAAATTSVVAEGVVTWRGGRTWYRVSSGSGGATPLLCLHGGPGSTHNYFTPLDRLADERPVVLYDQAGCGRSERAPDAEWAVESFLEELAVLRAALGLDEVHVLGSSWGGMLALEHALAAGGVRSLVLSSTLSSVEQWQREVRRLRDALPADVVEVLDRCDRTHTYDTPDCEAALEVFDATYVYRGAAGTAELERMLAERGPEAYRSMWGPNEWTVTGALAGWDVRSRLGEIDVPCLVIRGRYDLCTEVIARTLVDALEDARSLVFEESSHMPVVEERDRYVREVARFLRDVDRGDRSGRRRLEPD